MIEGKGLTGGRGKELHGLSFRLKNGEAYGFLEGRGEASVLLCMLGGCLTPVEGSVLVGGLDLYREGARAKRGIGFVPAQVCFPPSVTVLEALRFVADVKGLSFERGVGRITHLLESVDLEDRREVLISSLSPVEQRLVSILQALMTEPEILILEDPARGLSGKEQRLLSEVLLQLREKKTLFLSGDLSFLRQNCTEIFTVRDGSALVAFDGVSEMTETAEEKTEKTSPSKARRKKGRFAMLLNPREDCEILSEDEEGV